MVLHFRWTLVKQDWKTLVNISEQAMEEIKKVIDTILLYVCACAVFVCVCVSKCGQLFQSQNPTNEFLNLIKTFQRTPHHSTTAFH